MPKTERKKVVAHLKDGSLIKGYLDSAPDSRSAFGEHLPSILSLQVGDEANEAAPQTNLDLDNVKALFFVESFEGNPEYREVKFFETTPRAEGLWVRTIFRDNEVIEGIVHNSLSYIVSQGFFLKPPDPQSNNKMIYVVKNSIKDFRVLGVRNKY